MNKIAFIQSSVIAETLAQAPVQGKRLLEPLKRLAVELGAPINILEDHQALTNEAEVHTREGDLWHCLEGEVEFQVGGEMVEPWFKKLADGSENRREIKAKKIAGAERHVLKPGDWLWIPPGVPHTHRASGTARLYIIKIPASLA